MKIPRCAAAALTVLTLLLSASPAFTQRPGRPSEEEVRRLVERIRSETDHFRRTLDSALDRSSFDESRAEDRVNDLVREFDRSTDRLRGHPDESAAVQEVLDRAATIDRFVYRRASSGPVFDDWMSLRADLDRLASIYGVGSAWTAAGVAVEPAPHLAPSPTPQRINDHELKAVISRLDSEADRFRRSLREALSHSRVKHSDESDINRYVKNFDSATDRLKHHFDSHNTAAADAEEVMRRAAEIDGFMRSRSLNGRAHEDWRALRRDLDTLAAAYGVSWRWED